MVYFLFLIFLVFHLSIAGILDPKLKKLIKTHDTNPYYEVTVKALTKEGKFKLLKVPVSRIKDLLKSYIYLEAPRKIFPLNDVAVSESYAVFGNIGVSVNTYKNFSGYVAEGRVNLPQNCKVPFPQLWNYFVCFGPTQFYSPGSFKLILNNVERKDIVASQVYRIGTGASESGKTGKGVVIGIVDTGINFCHPAFLNKEGRTRIKFFGFLSSPFNCDGYYDPELGVCEYDENKINELIARGYCRYDSAGHGTHVAGIAAGYWKGSLYNGVAPESTLIVYKLSEMSDYDAAIGLLWMKKKSKILGLPTVVNFSLGTHYGPHDGTSYLSRIVDEVSGPGFVVVSAVGNSGHVPVHARINTQRAIVGLRVNSAVDVEGWYKKNSAYRIEVCSSFRCMGANPGQSVEATLGGCFVGIDNTILSHPLNGDGYFLISIYCLRQTDFKLRLTALRGSNLRVDMWIANFYSQEGYFLDHYEKEETGGYKYTVTVPATARRIISVGAIGSKPLGDRSAGPYLGRVAPFSSRGPTRDGRIRPHVVAPGYYVCSANNYFSVYSDKVSCGKGEFYVPLAGTSMAAPVVTGLVALYLQDNPTATPEEVKAWLATNAVRDVNVKYPNLAYGYGKAVYSSNRNFLLSGEGNFPVESVNSTDAGDGGGSGGCNSLNSTLPSLIGLILIRHLLLSLWKRLR